MQRILFILCISALFLLTGWSTGVAAETKNPATTSLQAGVHYDLISPAVPRSGSKPEVVEIFNFKCPHCFSLAPHTAIWAKKNQERILFKSIPIYWGKQTDIPVRAFFAAEFLGKGEEMKQAIFKAHFDNSADIENLEEMVFLAEATGMESQAFRTHMNSFGVSSKIAQAKSLQQAFRTSSTPTLVINGTYQVMPGKHAKGATEPVDYEKLFAIVEKLATQ
ncbi:MAG: thiol:disulfide interchange protein DsbA/DsbL [Magnetococcus sp. YQC-3]